MHAAATATGHRQRFSFAFVCLQSSSESANKSPKKDVELSGILDDILSVCDVIQKVTLLA